MSRSRYALLISDMDSTIAEGETIVDMAEALGIGPKIAQITEQAMRGELDFREALEARVAMLRGLKLSTIQRIADAVRLSEGAHELLSTCRDLRLRTVLVSGGFDLIADVVGARLGFDRVVSNRLEIEEDALSGVVLDPVVTAHTKAAVLREECQALNIPPSRAVALGDGANDVAMIREAGLGVAYRGKAMTRAAADLCLDHLTDLASHLVSSPRGSAC